MKKFYNRLNFNQLSFRLALQRWLTQHLPCPLCDHPTTRDKSSSTLLCTACVETLPWYTAPRCPQCALPTSNGDYCGICLQHPPAFDRTLTLLRYAYPLDRLLQQFKYHQQLPIGKWLVEAMLTKQASLFGEQRPDVMIAMPMHMERIKLRGFNHALELATHLHHALKIPLNMDGCTRVVDTPTQAGMDMKTRTRNLRGAFASPQQWQEKHVMVVDDVMTTGASMHAVARVLKQAGATQVTAVVFARTLKELAATET